MCDKTENESIKNLTKSKEQGISLLNGVWQEREVKSVCYFRLWCLDCSTMYSCRHIPTIQRYMLPPSLDWISSRMYTGKIVERRRIWPSSARRLAIHNYPSQNSWNQIRETYLTDLSPPYKALSNLIGHMQCTAVLSDFRCLSEISRFNTVIFNSIFINFP
jgi:hypothetical protein